MGSFFFLILIVKQKYLNNVLNFNLQGRILNHKQCRGMGNEWVMVSPQQFFFDVPSSHTHCSSMSLLHRSKSFMTCSITGCCPEFRTALSLQQGYSKGFKGTSAPAPRAPPPSLTGMFTGTFLSVFFPQSLLPYFVSFTEHFARDTRRVAVGLAKPCVAPSELAGDGCVQHGAALASPHVAALQAPATGWAPEPGTARYVLILTESSQNKLIDVLLKNNVQLLF